MAEDIASGLSSLQSRLDKMDKTLGSLENQFIKTFPKAVAEGAAQAGVSVDKFLDSLIKLVSAKGASKMQMVFDIATKVNGQNITLKDYVKNLEGDIERLKGVAKGKISRTSLMGGIDVASVDQAKELLKQYKEIYRLMSDPAKLHDTIMSIAGKGAQDAGKELQRLNNIRKENIDARVRDEKNAERLIAEERKKRSKEYQDALKKQEQNYLRYQRNVNERRQLKAAISRNKDGIATPEQQTLLQLYNKRIQDCVTSMRQLEKAQQGVTAAAAKNTLPQRQQMVDQTTKSIAQAQERHNKQLEKAAAAANKLKNAYANIATAAASFFSISQIRRFANEVIKTRGEFEMTEVALKNIIGNQRKSNDIWRKTLKLAVNSPMTAQQLLKATKQLAAFRVETNSLYKTTKMLADVSVGLGVDIERLILAYGHTKSSGFLRGMYARQFATAGVNIYGDLADYYTKKEGKQVSFKDVYERISKKQVTFADVEKVFEKMTSKGGTFYQMQDVLSNTVQGQINKIKDTWQQAMNEIGEAQTGVIRGTTNVILGAIKNWREFGAAVEGVAAGFGLFKTIQIVGVMSGWTSVAGSAGAMTNKLAGGLKGLGERMGSLFKGGAKGGLWGLAAAAIIGVTVALIALHKRRKEYEQSFNKQLAANQEEIDSMDALQKRIDANNETLKDAKSKTDDLTKAKKDNALALGELKNKYPDLYTEIKQTTDGVIELNDALLLHKQRLQDENDLLNLLKTGRGQAAKIDFEQKESALATKKNELILTQQYARAGITQLRGRDFGKYSEQEKGAIENILREWADFDLSGDLDKAVVRFSQVTDKLNKIGLKRGEIVKLLGQRMVNFAKDEGSLEELEKIAPTIKEQIINNLRRIYGDEIGEDIDEWIVANAEKLNDDAENGINTANKIVANTLGFVSSNMQAWGNKNLWNIIGWKGYNFFAGGDVSKTTGEEPPTEDPNGKTYKSIENLISLLKTMNSEYNKLSKSAYGFAKSQEKVMEVFKDSFKDILRATAGGGFSVDDVMTMVNWNTVDITSKGGVGKALQQVYDYLDKHSLWGQFGKNIDEIKKKFKKEIATQSVEVDMEVSVKFREDFGKEMEKMFSDYELSVEVQSMGLPKDAAKDFLGLDYVSLDALMARIKKFRTDAENTVVGKDENGNDILKNYMDEEDRKTYESWMKKVDDEIFKMRKENAKQYTKFLEQELSERAKLTMQYELDTAFVISNFQEEQQQTILQNLKDKYEQGIDELDWKKFKESDFYVEMMQDLTSMPSEYLDLMLEQLDKWMAKSGTLSPKAFKELMRARTKVQEAQVAMSPVRAMVQARAGIRDFQNTTRTDSEGNEIRISKSIRESREQLHAIMVEREKNIQKTREQLQLEEDNLGALTAQEQLQEKLSQLTGSGLEMTSSWDADRAEIKSMIDAKESELNMLSEPLVQKEGEKESEFKEAQKQQEERLEELRQEIELLKQIYHLREQVAVAGIDPTADVSADKRKASANVRKLKKELDQLEKEQASDTEINEKYKQWAKAVHGVFQNISSVTTKVKDLGNQWYDTMEVMGKETNNVTDAWKDFGNEIVDVITQALELIPALVTGYTAAGVKINAAMGVIGLIALGINLVLTLLKGLSKIHDAGYEDQIEDMQEKIDDLTRAYERLEKQMEKTWDSVKYMSTYNEMVQNLQEQIAALEKQREAEMSKKNSDEEKIQDYEEAIQDAYDNIEELSENKIEIFGGIGKHGYLSAAEEFVDAWKEAFLETGDGLQGLQDHFDEFLQEWFVKQATMRIAGKMLEKTFSMIDDAVDENKQGGVAVTTQELQAIRDQFAAQAPLISEALEALAGQFDLNGEGGLSGLAAGIQGITEEQADVLEAYWNDVRMSTKNMEGFVGSIANILRSNDVNTNPMLGQLTLIANRTDNINRLLDSVVVNEGSGMGIRTYVP